MQCPGPVSARCTHARASASPPLRRILVLRNWTFQMHNSRIRNLCAVPGAVPRKHLRALLVQQPRSRVLRADSSRAAKPSAALGPLETPIAAPISQHQPAPASTSTALGPASGGSSPWRTEQAPAQPVAQPAIVSPPPDRLEHVFAQPVAKNMQTKQQCSFCKMPSAAETHHNPHADTPAHRHMSLASSWDRDRDGGGAVRAVRLSLCHHQTAILPALNTLPNNTASHLLTRHSQRQRIVWHQRPHDKPANQQTDRRRVLVAGEYSRSLLQVMSGTRCRPGDSGSAGRDRGPLDHLRTAHRPSSNRALIMTTRCT